MADYKLTIHFVGGTVIDLMARNQIDDINVFTERMSNIKSGYFTKVSGVNSIAVNTNNVTYINIDKIEKEK